MLRTDAPRIALIHALAESVEPIHAAFAESWPQAKTFDLLDSSLSRDLAHAGTLTPAIIERFVALGRYAESSVGEGGRTTAILFTCSAFGPAIEAVKQAIRIPVLRPNEAAFEDALTVGGRIGLLVSFPPSLPALHAELSDMARLRGVRVKVEGQVVEGALEALQRGNASQHDYLVAEAAARMPPTDCLVLGQFSLARAAQRVIQISGRAVLTTPTSAVLKLREICAGI